MRMTMVGEEMLAHALPATTEALVAIFAGECPVVPLADEVRRVILPVEGARIVLHPCLFHLTL